MDGLEVAEVAAVLGRWADPLAALTASERARAERFATRQLRDEFTAAHLLVRERAALLLGLGAAEVVIEQRCAECGGEHGAPAVAGHPEVRISWSHSHGWVGALASPAAVGVDVEAPRAPERALEPGLLRRTATEAERELIEAAADPRAAFLRAWVLKEALIKVGRIALADFARTDVSGALTDAAGAVVLGCRVRLHPHPVVTVGTATVIATEE